jgi:hypothetical protein
VSASEIGTYEYCARAYWLERVQGVERLDGAESRLVAGTAQHRAHGRRVAWQRWMLRSALVFLGCGAVLLLVHAAADRVGRALRTVPVFSL